MRLIGWAIALAAAGMTPAAAQAPSNTPTPAQSAAASTATPASATIATPPAGTAQNPGKADAGQAATSATPGIPEMAPTPNIGQPNGSEGLQPQFTPIGREARDFHNYWLLPLCAGICIIVLVLLLFAIVRFRRSANAVPSRNSHNTVIEVIWTLVPVLILVAIAIPSIRLVRHQYSPPPADLTVKVTGHQWYWSYELPDNGVQFDSYMLKEANDPTRQANQRARTPVDGPPLLAVDNRLVIPAGKVVKFIVTADDVIHSFAVPAFWIKQDANPGQLHETWVKVDRPGVYFGQCSELCGARHGFMPIAVQVVPPAEFAAWVVARGGHMGPPAPGTPDTTAASPVSTSAMPSTAPPVTGGTAAGTPAPAVAGTAVDNSAPAPNNKNVANRTNH